MDRVIMHIDMDAFFASVEQLDNPELRGLPVAVGGDTPRSVVSAASYEIRKFGVHSAMPVVKARQLCPQGVFLPGRMHRYKEISRQVMEIVRRFSPLVEQASVDEAYVDISGSERLMGPPRILGQNLKDAVRRETGLTCSVGIAPNKFLAKIASDLEKPDGLTLIEPERVEEFMRTLPVEKIPGVGTRSLETLHKLGVRVAGDVLKRPEEFWKRRLGDRSGLALYERARGVHRSPVTPVSRAKSMSAENTFAEDTLDRAVLEKYLLRQAERVGADLRRHGATGRTVTLKAKYADFHSVTRSRTLSAPTASTRTLYETGRDLLRELDPRQPLRLIGLGASHLNFGERPLSLLEDGDTRQESLDQAIDVVRGRFGGDILKRGKLME